MKRQLDERIADWVDGRLSPRELARLEAEFEVNSKLFQAAEEYRESVEQVRRALAEPEMPVDLADRVLAEIQLKGARPRLVKALPLLASFAAAAAMILLFLGLYWVQPGVNRGEVLEVASRETQESEAADKKAGEVVLGDLVAGELVADGLVARDEIAMAEIDGPRREAGEDRVLRERNGFDELPRPAQTRAKGFVGVDEDGAANRRANEGAVAGKAGALGREDRGLKSSAEAARDQLTAVVNKPFPLDLEESAPLDETLAWLQEVVGDRDDRAADFALVVDTEKDREEELEKLLDLGRALELLASRADAPVEPSTPVVVFNLPAAEGPITGGPTTGDPITGETGASDPSRELQDLFRRVQGPPPRSAAKTLERENARPRALKNQDLQETLEWALLPVSNVDPPILEEFDPRSRQTLQNLQSVVGFSDLASQQGYFSNVTVDVPVGADGRAFHLQGDREQLAQFLRRVSDWGRAKQAVVEFGQVTEEVVRQSRLSPRPQVAGEQSRAPAAEGRSQDARGGRGRRGGAAPYTREQISVLLLFQSGALAQKKNK